MVSPPGFVRPLYVIDSPIKTDSIDLLYLNCYQHLMICTSTHNKVNPKTVEIFLYKAWRPKGYFQFKIITKCLC